MSSFAICNSHVPTNDYTAGSQYASWTCRVDTRKAEGRSRTGGTTSIDKPHFYLSVTGGISVLVVEITERVLGIIRTLVPPAADPRNFDGGSFPKLLRRLATRNDGLSEDISGLVTAESVMSGMGWGLKLPGLLAGEAVQDVEGCL